MNKFIISIIAVGIILLAVASFFLINRNDVNNIGEISEQSENNSSQSEQSGTSQITPIKEIDIAGIITSVSIEGNAAILEIEEFDGRMQEIRIDDTASIIYTDSSREEGAESGERVEIPSVSYSDIEEGQRISATILQKGDDLSTIQYRGPVLIYE